MRNTLAIAVFFALLAGVHSFVRRNDAQIIKRQCSREGTLRTFRFSDNGNTPLFCECLPGFDGRYCETRICKNGVIRTQFEEIESADGDGTDVTTTTICKCYAGFVGPTCEERAEQKYSAWATIVAYVEPIIFFVAFMIPFCFGVQMAIEFVAPLFNRDRYSMLYVDAERAMKPAEPAYCRDCCCEKNSVSSAPPAYGHIYSNPPPSVSPMADLRQPIYTERKIYNHV